MNKTIQIAQVEHLETKNGKDYRKITADDGFAYSVFDRTFFPIIDAGEGKAVDLTLEKEGKYWNVKNVTMPGAMVQEAVKQGAKVEKTTPTKDTMSKADWQAKDEAQRLSIHRQVGAKLAVEAWCCGKIDKEHLKDFATFWVNYFEKGE